MQRQVRIHVCLSVIGALALGCSDDAAQTSPGDAGPMEEASAEDAAVGEAGEEDVAPDAPPDGLEMLVVEVPDTPFSAGSDLAPVEGATMAVDFPDGTRQEFTSDAEGKITLPDMGAADDKVVMTTYHAGYAVWSWEGPVEKAAQNSTVLLWSQSRSPRVILSGTATGMTDISHYLTVSSNSAFNFSQKTGNKYAIYVTPGQPLSALGVEWAGCERPCPRCLCQEFFGWTGIDHDAVTENTTADLDFSQSLTPIRTTGTIVLPERADSPIRTDTWPNLSVTSFFGAMSHGFPQLFELNDDGSAFTYTAEHVVLEGSTDVATFYVLLGAGWDSSVIRPGYPEPGAVVSGFLDIPTMISPSSPDEPISILDAFEWEPRETTSGRLQVSNGKGLVWVATSESGSSIRLPRLPSTADPADVLGTSSLNANLTLMAPAESTPPGEPSPYAERSITSGIYKVVP